MMRTARTDDRATASKWRLALPVVLVFVASGCSWTMFGYGPEHTHFDPTEKTIGVGNVAGLTTAWTAATDGTIESSPAIVNGVAYVGTSDGQLLAFSAAGTTGCSGSPKTCTPLWSGTTAGEATAKDIRSSAAVVNGVVYIGSTDGNLYAFDAAGSTGCSGTPKTCDALWTAATGSIGFSSPTVTNGVVYVGSEGSVGKLYAFDAAGSTGCSGVPKTCLPLWTATTADSIESSPAVANGVVYVGAEQLYAFDAAGSTGCSGAPKTCLPLWTAATGNSGSSPAVVSGIVYIGTGDGKLAAVDAAGSTGCSGIPKTCLPLWTASIATFEVESSPAVANGVVYIGSDDRNLYAFDAAGSTGCSGVPKTCLPLWTGAANDIINSSPTVANGVVYVGSEDKRLWAFDAAGSSGCSGTPKTCNSLWKTATGGSIHSSPAVANGIVYVGSGDSKLYAFKP